MFPPGKNLGMPGTRSTHHSRFPRSDSTGPLPFPKGSPWLPDAALQAASFPKAWEPGRATWKQLPSGKQRGEDWRASSGGGWRGAPTLPS